MKRLFQVQALLRMESLPTLLQKLWKVLFWITPASNARRNSQPKSHQRNYHKYLRLFVETWILIFKNTPQLLIRAFTDNLMMTRLQFIFKKMLNGLVFMMDMVEQSALSSSNKSYTNTFSILIGEKMCLQL